MRHAEVAGPGIEAKIGIEGTIFLAGNYDVFDRIDAAGARGGRRMRGGGKIRPPCRAGIKRQPNACQRAKLSQSAAPRVPAGKVCLQIHKYLLLNNKRERPGKVALVIGSASL